MDRVPVRRAPKQIRLDVIELGQHEEFIDIQERHPLRFVFMMTQRMHHHVELLPLEREVVKRDERRLAAAERQHLAIEVDRVLVVAVQVDVIEAERLMVQQPFGDVGGFRPHAGHDRNVILRFRHWSLRFAPRAQDSGQWAVVPSLLHFAQDNSSRG